MIALLLFVLSNEPEPIDMSAGYYSLTEIAARAKVANVNVSVDRTLAEEVFAVSLRRTQWSSVVKALAYDGTLDISGSGTQWTIKPNKALTERDSKDLQTYLQLICRGLGEPYREAKSKVEAIKALPLIERDVEIGKLQYGASPAEPLVAKLVRDVLLNNSRPQVDLSLSVEALELIQKSGLNGRRRGTLFDYGDDLVSKYRPEDWNQFAFIGIPSGSTPESVSARQSVLKSIPVELRATFDPDSSALAYSLSMFPLFHHRNGQAYDSIYRQSLFRGTVATERNLAPIKTAEIFGDKRETELVAEKKSSDNMLSQDSRLQGKLPANSEAILSDVLLHYAELHELNFVFRLPKLHLNSFSILDGQTLADALKLACSQTSATSSVQGRLVERIGEAPTSKNNLIRLTPLFTLAQSGDVLVLRDWLHFTDQLCDVAGPLERIVANQRLNKKPLDLLNITAVVANMNVSTAKSGVVSGAVLDYFSPLSFLPFARLIKSSNTFRGAIEHLQPDKAAVIELTEIDVASLRVFASAFHEIDPILADRTERLSGEVTYGHLRNLDPQDFSIRVQRSTGIVNDSFTFTLRKEGERVWSTTVKAYTATN